MPADKDIISAHERAIAQLAKARYGPESVGNPATMRQALESLTVLSTLAQARTAVNEIAATAQRLISIYSPDLEPDLYEQPAFLEVIKRFVLNRSFAKVRVLLGEPTQVMRDSNRFVAMRRRLSSCIDIRYIAAQAPQRAAAYLIADDRGIVYRMRADTWDGVADMNNPPVAKLYLQEFDSLWNAAYESQVGSLKVTFDLYQRSRGQLLENEPLRARSPARGSAPNVLSIAEIDALQSVGLSTERWAEGGRVDPLAQSIADYMALLDTSLTTSQAATLLKVDPSRIRQRLREGSLYGIEYDGEKRLPRFQFERRKVVPGLAEILPELPPQMSPLDVAEWFLAPNPDLQIDEDGPISPREWLLTGRAVAAIVALARGFE
jgi:hypothetical protein